MGIIETNKETTYYCILGLYKDDPKPKLLFYIGVI